MKGQKKGTQGCEKEKDTFWNFEVIGYDVVLKHFDSLHNELGRHEAEKQYAEQVMKTSEDVLDPLREKGNNEFYAYIRIIALNKGEAQKNDDK